MLESVAFEHYFWIIYFSAFATSIVSAVAGFMGGAMLLAVMAQFLKLEVLIPLHAIIQLGSNMSRGWFLRPFINWQISRDAIIGTIFGGVAGYFYMVQIPEHGANLVMGLFILLITIVPKFKANFHFPGKWILIGFVACSLGLLVGAIGALVGSLLLSENLEKKAMVSTQATLQTIIHRAKLLVFMSIGFVVWPWMLLVVGAVVCTYLGTFVGTKILDLIPQKLFMQIMVVLVLALSGRLIFMGLIG